MARTVAGLFDSHRTADLVVEHLVQEYGVPRERVRVLALDAAGSAEERSPQDSDQGASLHDLGLPEDNLRAYAEGLRRGGILVAAQVEEGRVGRVVDAYKECRGRLQGIRRERSAGARGGMAERGPGRLTSSEARRQPARWLANTPEPLPGRDTPSWPGGLAASLLRRLPSAR